MPVHFDYQGHVGQDPRRTAGPSIPTRKNLVLNSTRAYIEALERAIGDHDAEKFAAVRAALETQRDELVRAIDAFPITGTQFAMRPK